ncbi:hypothetical protein [Halovivax gelatinilyticus]|nr:hypothetical protein [Halovivax gelatinilyticus]
MEPGKHERRPFFACESCAVVVARTEPPRSCRLCESDLFTEVMPREVAQ